MMQHNATISIWHSRSGQVLVGGLGSVMMALFLYFGGAAGGLLLAAVTCLPARALVLSFVCLSYFRIHEAYPFLIPLKLPLVFGTASLITLAIISMKVIRSSDTRKSHWLALALLATVLMVDVVMLTGLSDPGTSHHRILFVLTMLLAASAFYAWYRTLDGMNAVRWGNEVRLFVAFFILVSIGVSLARNPSVAFEYWNNNFWKIGAITLILAWVVREERDYRAALWMLLASGCLIALVTCHNWLFDIDLVEGTRVTIGMTLFSTPDDIANAVPGLPIKGSSQLGDPNDLALVLLFPVGLALAVLVQFGLRSAIGWLSGIALPLLIAAIVMTQSRGAALGVVAVFGAISLFYIRSKFLLVVLMLVGTLGLVALMDIGGRQSGGLAELEGHGIDRSALERIHAWGAAISMTGSWPLNGVGLNNFTDQFRAHTPVWSGRNMAAHSTWFEVMAETGIPGIALFFAVLISVVVALHRSWITLQRYPDEITLRAFCMGLFAALAGFCAAGTFLSQGFRWPLYLLIGFAAALSCTTRQLDQAKNGASQ
jgi:O-antigen ligase